MRGIAAPDSVLAQDDPGMRHRGGGRGIVDHSKLAAPIVLEEHTRVREFGMGYGKIHPIGANRDLLIDGLRHVMIRSEWGMDAAGAADDGAGRIIAINGPRLMRLNSLKNNYDTLT